MPANTLATELSQITVLLAEDEDTLRNMEATLLEALGFHAIVAANGSEALQLYKTRGSEIDMIMLDLIMPEMGGIEAYLELRKLDATVPIIICSGYDAESVADFISVDDRASFLHKPYNPAELRRVLNKMTGE